MTVQSKDRAGLEILPFAECLRLLGTVPVGRIGFLCDGEVVILPVNHVTDGQSVVFRSNSGSKLCSVGSKNLVGFEADDYDTPTRSGWSVVLSGFTEVVEDDKEIQRLEHLGLESWGGAGADASWIRVRPTAVTGRRTSGAAFAAIRSGGNRGRADAAELFSLARPTVPGPRGRPRWSAACASGHTARSRPGRRIPAGR